ncbi:hypothetical protein [Streptobacillus canis]|uniref:hypothetical protein n=1 Tax=Streptobacillus canis TaxID=2678686 RepID=UPI0012E153F7|nr:hypothetical protein [Streptobacillus canis]
MKKILLILFLFISLNLFSNQTKTHYWYSFKHLNKNIENLEPFDIVILSKGKKFVQQFGHLFMVNKEKKLIEIKGFEDFYSDNPIYSFAHITNRKVSVLRYTKMTKELIDELDKLLPKYYNKKYSVIVGNDPDNLYTYCSNFAYNIFAEASKNIGLEKIELVKNKFPILPYDFFQSDNLVNIYLGEEI